MSTLEHTIPEELQRTFVFQTAGMSGAEGIYFGFKTVRRVGEIAGKLGRKNAFIVAGPSMVKTGCAQLVQDILSEHGVRSQVFFDIETEPQVETANKAWAFFQQHTFDLVIGLGGGSPMDLAKAIATLATNPQTPLEMMTTKNITKPAMDMILITTTAGTGSDVSGMFLLADGKKKLMIVSPLVYPKVSITDPEFILSVPAHVAAATGMDAMSHAMEAVMNKNANDFYDSIALGGIKLINQYLPGLCSPGRTLADCYHVSMGAMMAMVAFNGVGGLYAHSYAHILNMFRTTPHGVGCGISLPFTMAYNLPAIPGQLAKVAAALGFAPGGDEVTLAKKGIERIYELHKQAGLPGSLKEMGFNADDLDAMAEKCIEIYPRPNNPRPMDVKDCRALLEGMWDGTITYF